MFAITVVRFHTPCACGSVEGLRLPLSQSLEAGAWSMSYQCRKCKKHFRLPTSAATDTNIPVDSSEWVDTPDEEGEKAPDSGFWDKVLGDLPPEERGKMDPNIFAMLSKCPVLRPIGSDMPIRQLKTSFLEDCEALDFSKSPGYFGIPHGGCPAIAKEIADSVVSQLSKCGRAEEIHRAVYCAVLARYTAGGF